MCTYISYIYIYKNIYIYVFFFFIRLLTYEHIYTHHYATGRATTGLEQCFFVFFLLLRVKSRSYERSTVRSVGSCLATDAIHLRPCVEIIPCQCLTGTPVLSLFPNSVNRRRLHSTLFKLRCSKRKEGVDLEAETTTSRFRSVRVARLGEAEAEARHTVPHESLARKPSPRVPFL